MKERQLKTGRRKISPRKYTRKNRYFQRTEEIKKAKVPFWQNLKEKLIAYWENLFGHRTGKELSVSSKTDRRQEPRIEEKKGLDKSPERVSQQKPKEQSSTIQEWSPKGNGTPAQSYETKGPSENQAEQPTTVDQKEIPSQPEPLPVEQTVTSNKLYVGNLPYNLTDSDLFEIFAKIGPIKNVEIVRDRKSNRTKGFGFVEMADLESARKAATVLNRIEIMGRRIIVTGAKSERKDTTQT
ncbi:RNA-binding protein [Methylacidiphilum caldifontis]|uniref:RNA-binding protein n=1 Tax=Methylacidiphilum caldifontis TaxID=2795386 RepID=UPI001FC96600|nr:RNA-binding protein [Methylacidiphilum caldifontis]